MTTNDEFKELSKEVSVLYVEDDEFLQFTTSKLLEIFFKEIVVAKDGKEGLAMYTAKKYDIVITDIRMPIMGGREMVEKIKEINNDQYIVVTSGDDNTDTLLDFIELGIDAFVLKPLDMNKIISVLYKLCKNIKNEKILEKMKEKKIYDSFAVTANHRINQYLTGILGYTDLSIDLLEEDVINKETIVNYLNKVKDGSMGISGILKKFRTLKEISFEEYVQNTDMLKIDDD